MDNQKRNKTARGPRIAEKPKDFKVAIQTLFSNLKDFKKTISIALILAALGSLLAIISPNYLSDLTDEISKGLIINTENLEEVTKHITANLSEEKMPSIMQEVMISEDIKEEDKLAFQNILMQMEDENVNILAEIPESIRPVIFPETTFLDQKISTTDKVQFLEVMSSLDEDTSQDEIYKVLEELPESISKLIEPEMNMSVIKNITIFLLIVYIVSALFTYIQAIAMTNVSNKFARSLRMRISKKINKMPLNYFDHNETGDTLSRVTNDVDTIAQSMNQSLGTLVSSITLLIGSVFMMFWTNYVMAITAIVASLIGFVFVSIILSKSQKYFTARQKELGKLNGHIEEVYSGLNVVKAYNGKMESLEEFDRLNDKVYECNRKSQFLSGLMMPLMAFIGNFGYVAVCIVGALLVNNGSITFGVIVAFIIYVRLFTNPLTQLAQAMTALQSTAAASERVFDFLNEKEMSSEKNIKEQLDKEKVLGNIEFDHVAFGYDKDKVIIKDFTAKVKAGSKVAIVGPTGAGKTTMVNLLMKFYEINAGDIKIDGVSIKDLKRENIHELFTMVLQDTWLFEGTVYENICYNRKNVSKEQIKEICEYVGVHHFIKTLPNGYDTILSDSDSISSGQKQLLTIARGMVENAPFLILDEATSNVDTRTEVLVQKAMDNLMKDRTSFIIAHRLSTIKNADLILVMQDGNIIENGSHDELMKQKGFYADLYNSQFKENN